MGELNVRSSMGPTQRAEGPPLVESDRLGDVVRSLVLPNSIEVSPEGPKHRL